MEFWGFDLETSGTELDFSATIQVGLYRENSSTMFCKTLGGWNWVDTEAQAVPVTHDAYWSPEAEKIHQIPPGKVDSSGRIWDVDGQAAVYVEGETRVRNRADRIMVGWNVAGFDRPFTKRDLLELYPKFSYRTVDLNAIVFSKVGRPGPGGRLWTYKTLKAYVKTGAEETARARLKSIEVIGEKDFRGHNAGFDAVTAIESFKILRTL